MRKSLYILGDLTDEDLFFLAEQGEVQSLSAGDVLIRARSQIHALYFITHGSFDVRLPDGPDVAKLMVGDVTGEMSFVEKQPPDADVIATEMSRVLAVPREVLNAQLQANPAFAGRFYKALATFLSDRLRTTTAALHGDVGAAGQELDERLLDVVHVAGDRMLRLIDLLEGKK